MRLVALILMLLVSRDLQAADPIACVDPDIRTTLLSNWYDSSDRVTTQVPDHFPPLPVPAELEFIGARTGAHNLLMAYKTDLPEESVLEAMATGVSGSDWVYLERQQMMPRGGFVSQRMRPHQKNQNFCNRSYGIITANYTDANPGTYVRLSYSMQHNDRSCKQTDPRHRMMNGPVLPTILLPPDYKGHGGGSSSSGDQSASSRTEFDTAWSLADIQADFTEQAINQKWLLETSWISASAAGNVAGIALLSSKKDVMLTFLISEQEKRFTAIMRADRL